MSSVTAIAWLLLLAVIGTLQCTDEFGNHSTSLPHGHAKAEVERHIRQVAGADFDRRVKLFVREIAKDIGRTIDWYDAYGKHWHLQEESPKYNKYQVRAHVEQVHYQTSRKRIQEQSNTVFVQWYHNDQPGQPLFSKIQRTIKKTNTFTWAVEKGLNIQLSLAAHASLPRIVNVTESLSVSLDLSDTQSTTKAKEQTFIFEDTLKVEPRTSLKVEWIITDRQVHIPWEAEVILDGWIAVWYVTKYDDHWLWFYPIGDMAGGDFKRRSDTSLVYRAVGVFEGIIGAESAIRVKQYPVIETKMRYGLEEDAISERLPLKTYVKYLQANGQALNEVKHGEKGD